MKIFQGWTVVAGSLAGVGFCSQIFIATGYTILAAGIASAFGWSVTDLALGATLFLGAQVVGYPIAGYITDRWGTRRAAIAGIVLFAVHLLILTRITAMWQLSVVMFSMGLFGPLTYIIPYARAISLWFVRKRGMAIGLVMAGTAFGGILYPLGIQGIIAASGWTQALLAMAALQLFVCLPAVALLVRDSPGPFGLRPDGDPPPAENSGAETTKDAAAEGMTFAEAVRSLDFWLLASVFFLVGLAVFAVLTNSVHIFKMTSSLDVAQVAKVQAVIGVTMLVGRLLAGALLDRFSDRWICVIINILAAMGFVGYAMSDNLVMAMASGACLGFAMGGEGNILPYMVAKYFGQKAFGKILGVTFGIFGLGTALGPVVCAWLMEATGIRTTLLIFAAIVFVSSANYIFVGRRKPSSSNQESQESQERRVVSNA